MQQTQGSVRISPNVNASVGQVAAGGCSAKAVLIGAFLAEHAATLDILSRRLSRRVEGPMATTRELVAVIVHCAAVRLLWSAQPNGPETTMFLQLLDTTARHDLRALMPPKPPRDRAALAVLACAGPSPH